MVSMEIRNNRFCAYIDEFTKNTNMMIITSDSNIRMFKFFYFKLTFINSL